MTDELLEQGMALDAPPAGSTCGDNGGITRAGARCRASLNLSPSSGLCVQHDPDRVEVARQLRLTGGRASGLKQRLKKAALPEHVPRAPKTIADAEAFASWLTHAVCVGDIDARTAHEAAVCLREFRGASEKRILEREIKALRQELAEAKRTRPRIA